MTSKKSLMAMLYGICTILIIVLGSSLILSLLLRLTDLEEASLSWVILAISALALFLGGLIAGGKGQEKGWLIGAGTGLLFTILVFLVQFLGYQTQFSLEQILFHVGYIFISLFGGIIGVNLSGKRAA